MPEIATGSWLRNYNWKSIKQLDGGKIVFTNDQYPNHELHVYDDGHIDHLIRGQKIATMNQKRLGNYLQGVHKY